MAKIEKIYKLTLEGESEMVSKINTASKSLDGIRRNFIDVKASSKGVFNNDKDINNYRNSLEKLNKELLKNQTISKILKNDNEAYLRVSKALNEIEKQKASSIQTTYDLFKKANSEAKSYYTQKVNSSNTPKSSISNYQSSISTNFNNLKTSGKTVEFAIGYAAEQKKLEDAQKRLNFEQSQYGKELAKTNVEIIKQKKENKDAAKELLGYIDLYDELAKKQRDAFNTAKVIGVEKGIYSREFQKAATEANYYDQQLKKIDFALGRFNRNVGNYKEGMFGLNNTMAQIMREMPAFTNSAQTGFMAISNNIPMFADAIAAVKQKNAELKKEFTEAAAAQKAFVFEQEIARGATVQAATATAAMAEAQVMANYQAAKAPGLWKQLGSAIFSWNSLMSIAITLMTVYGADIFKWLQKNLQAGKAVDKLAESQSRFNEALKSSDFKKAVRDISELRNNIDLAKAGFLSKDKVLKSYNETLGKVMGSARNLNEVEQILTKNADNYIKVTLYKAAANLALDKAAESMIKAEEARQKKLNDFKNSAVDSRISGGSMGMGGGSFNAQEYEAETQRIKKAREKRKNQEIKDATDAGKAQEDIAKNLMKQAASFSKGMNFDSILGKDDKTKKDKPYRGARLTGEQKDYLKDLEASRNNELAILETSYTNADILEVEFIQRSLSVNKKYYDDKIKYLKGGNAEERKQESQAVLDKTKAIKEANDKLYSIYTKQNDDEFSQTKADAERKRDLVLDNIYSTDQDKIQAEIDYQNEITNATLTFNQKMIDMEIDLGKQLQEELNKRTREAQEQIDRSNANMLKSKVLFLDAALQKVDDKKEELDNLNEINNAVARRNILENRKLTLAAKNIELEKLAKRLELDNINTELGSVNAKIMFMTWELTQRKLTNEELVKYNRLLREKAILEGNKAAATNSVNLAEPPKKSGIPGSGFSGLASAATSSLMDGNDQIVIDGVDYSDQAGYAIAQAFDVAQMSMESYFEAERQRIEQSRQLAYERIDLERAQSLRYAQSAAEREAIDKEAAAKKKKADRAAGEQLKKQKKNEAKIAFLMELANIWSTVWSLGNPIVAAIFGGVLSGLAVARYSSTVSSINATQYKKGGIFGKGGRLSGPSHSNGGMPVINPVTGEKVAEMEGKEGIINANSMADNKTYTITGKPSQIASKINAMGGGVDWFGGATLNKFATGGLFNWNRTKPPVFNSQREQFESMDADQNTDRLDRIEGMMEDLAKEQFKKVVVSSKEITSQQNESAKQTEIGTL